MSISYTHFLLFMTNKYRKQIYGIELNLLENFQLSVPLHH